MLKCPLARRNAENLGICAICYQSYQSDWFSAVRGDYDAVCGSKDG